MSSKIILIILGEPNSTFSEILFKYFYSNEFRKNNKKIILVGNSKLLKRQMRLLKYEIDLNEISRVQNSISKRVNIINVNYRFKKTFTKISNHSNKYIENCFNLSLDLIKKNRIHALINGPISKKHFLKKKFPGITEFIAKKTKSTNPVMLIYNKEIAVSPLTTHIPIKKVTSLIKKKNIINNVVKIDNFFKSKLKKKPKIAILALNPHCETTDKISEEKKEIIPAIKYLNKNKIKAYGPIAADTFFLKKNIKNFDIVVGMYHDQVLTPLKTLFEFEAINLTLGLPFIKVTPDHGPNHTMIGEKKSDPSSIFYAFRTLNKF